MKAKELIYNLRTNLSRTGSQVAEYTDQHLMYMLDEARAVLAARKMDQKVNLVQMSQFVDVAPREATKEELGKIGTSKVLRIVIPDPIAFSNGPGIFSVGPTDGKKNYTQISYSGLQTQWARKYTSQEPKWFLFENSIYIINVSVEATKKVRVRGIFDEPHKVEQQMGRYKYLTPFSWEYPLSMKDADSVYKLAMGSDMGWGDQAVAAINAAEARQRAQNEKSNASQGA